MRLLADTEAVIRFAVGKLPQRARDAMTDPENKVFVSAASVWEIATKTRIGELVLPDVVLAKGLSRWIADDGFALLPIGSHHAELAGFMAIDHRDPWDRMILAQARIEEMPIIGSDRIFERHATGVIWR